MIVSGVGWGSRVKADITDLDIIFIDDASQVLKSRIKQTFLSINLIG